MFKADPLMLVQESLARVNELRKEFLICIELRIVIGKRLVLAHDKSKGLSPLRGLSSFRTCPRFGQDRGLVLAQDKAKGLYLLRACPHSGQGKWLILAQEKTKGLSSFRIRQRVCPLRIRQMAYPRSRLVLPQDKAKGLYSLRACPRQDKAKGLSALWACPSPGEGKGLVFAPGLSSPRKRQMSCPRSGLVITQDKANGLSSLRACPRSGQGRGFFLTQDKANSLYSLQAYPLLGQGQGKQEQPQKKADMERVMEIVFTNIFLVDFGFQYRESKFKQSGKEYPQESNLNFFLALLERWDLKTTTIRDNHKLDEIDIDEIYGLLETHELEIEQRNNRTRKKAKSVALKIEEKPVKKESSRRRAKEKALVIKSNSESSNSDDDSNSDSDEAVSDDDDEEQIIANGCSTCHEVFFSTT
ncbi:hypothetical protein AgCh_026927 [Apium graveolens]